LKLVSLLFCWIPLLGGSATALTAKNFGAPLSLCLILVTFQVFLTGSLMLSPILSTNFLVIDYVLSLVHFAEINYESRLRGVKMDELDYHLDLGLRLHHLKLRANDVLSPKLLAVFVASSMTVLFGGFFGTLLVTAFRHADGFNGVQFLNGIYFFILAVLEVAKTLYLARKGQAIRRCLRDSQNHLEIILFIKANDVPDYLKTKVACLTHHWASTSYLRPMDAFNLDLASTLSLFGVLLTYIIVLMQFKFGEII
jgi:hypothetical protein